MQQLGGDSIRVAGLDFQECAAGAARSARAPGAAALPRGNTGQSALHVEGRHHPQEHSSWGHSLETHALPAGPTVSTPLSPPTSPASLLSHLQATAGVPQLVWKCIFQALRMKSRPVHVAHKACCLSQTQLCAWHRQPSRELRLRFLPQFPLHRLHLSPWQFVLGLDVTYSRELPSEADRTLGD